MEKDAAVKFLLDKGIHAYNERGIVMIDLKESTHTESSVRKLLKDIGYDSSFGIIKKGNGTSRPLEKEEQMPVSALEEELVIGEDSEEAFPTFMDDNEQLTFQW